MDTIDEAWNFLQNKTIKDIGSDFYDNKYYLVIYQKMRLIKVYIHINYYFAYIIYNLF